MENNQIVWQHKAPDSNDLWGVFDFLAPFRFIDYFDGIVYVTFESVHQVRVLFQLPAPVFHLSLIHILLA